MRLGHCGYRLSHLLFENNSGDEGAAVFIESGATVLSMDSCAFKGNT
jgi:hypothetical protein